MRRLIIALIILGCIPAVSQATTYHVASNDKDGNGVVDQDGSCVNHSTVGSAWASCSDSVASNCTLAKPCCTMQAALDKAVAPGDIVEVHSGNYDAAIDGSTRVSLGGGTADFDVMSIVKPCAACTAEGDRRMVRGAIISTQDEPVLVGDASTEGAISIGGNGTNLATDFVTLQSFSISDFNYDEEGNCAGSKDCNAFVLGSGDGTAHYFVLDNITVGTMNGGTDLKETYAIFYWHAPFSGGNESDFGMIKNSTWTADVRLYHGAGGSSHSCKATGFIGKDNTFISSMVNSQNEIGNDQGVCGAWYRNYWDQTGMANQATRLHARAILGPRYVFNNYYRLKGRAQYTQASGDTSDSRPLHYHFNNTYHVEADGQDQYIIGTSETKAMGDGAGGYADASRFVNLLTIGDSVMGPSLDGAGIVMGGTHGYNAFGSANYCVGLGAADGAECPDGWAVDLGNMQAGTSDFGLKETGAWPVPRMQLDTGSAMIGVGTNDPLGQGAGICSIDPVAEWGCGDDNSNGNCDPGEICQDAEACQLIDCAVDFDGDARGLRWDIGADQFVGTTSSLPPPAGVKRGEGTSP